MTLPTLITDQTSLSRIPPDAVITQHAAFLLNSAAKTVKAILARRAALDAAGQKSKPLAVVLGEDHAVVSHHLHHMLVLEGLEKAGVKIAIAMELSHDTLAKHFSAHTKFRTSHDLPALLEPHDKKGRLSILSSLALDNYCDSPYARNALLRLISSRETMPVKYTDASWYEGAIDRRDSSTGETLEDNGFEMPAIPLQSIEGAYARNLHMVKKSNALLEQHQADILVHTCGFVHVAGLSSRLPYRQSLAALFKKGGAGVLAMSYISENFRHNDLPINVELTEQELQLVEDLPSIEAMYRPSTNSALPGMTAALVCREDEAAYLNPLLQKVGLGDYCLSSEEQEKVQDKAQDDIAKEFARLEEMLSTKKPLSPGPC